MNEVTTEPQGGNKGPLIGFGLIVLLALAVGGYYYYMSSDNEPETPAPEGDAADILGLNGEGPVARVNGTEISREAYRRGAEQLMSAYTAQGADVSTSEAANAIKEQALNTLVNRQLVLAAAAEANISVNDEAVEAEYQNVLSGLGGDEGLAAALATADMSEAQLRADLREGLMINNYLSAQVGVDTIEVSDEEVTTYYETTKASSSTELPPLEEVRDLIKNQLLAEKQQQAINTEIERLRTGANIEILI